VRDARDVEGKRRWTHSIIGSTRSEKMCWWWCAWTPGPTRTPNGVFSFSAAVYVLRMPVSLTLQPNEPSCLNSKANCAEREEEEDVSEAREVRAAAGDES